MANTDVSLRFDESLPITAAVEEIRDLIRRHQVVVVAGATGSGKTTQLPKIAMLAGRSRIGHTQPRRIAARTVAERIASELGESLGETVGYQVRFQSKTSRQTAVKVMTDGILLAEIARDRDLRRYDTLIIDEAHERSLNIDFLLGYLKQLLPRRADLKVLITSATIDTERFSAHFSQAPVVEIPGRTYPVELRYRPVLDGAADADLLDAICAAVRELDAAGPGDMLVFCSGERDIADAAEAINGLGLRFTEVVPLYARLSAAEQHRVFAPHTGRRIVLATNVAETSLTVPGIRYVVDPGYARISRYSARTKVQRLPIEAISQASANQRAGRCGRLGPGICIRLYSEEDFAARPEFTEPEIQRTNLAAVILQMAQSGLGEIADFPFLEPPDGSQVRDGIRLLRELGALEVGKRTRLTPIGRQLARLPIDPRLARMLVEAHRLGCLREVEAIVAGLAVVDVRERPVDNTQAADASHRRFWAPLGTDGEEATPDGSDVAALLRLWRYLRRQRSDLSGNGFRRMCRQEFFHLMRVREWQDLNAQIKQVCRGLGWNRNDEPADLDKVHMAVLSGLLSHVGLLDEGSGSAKPGQRRRGPAEYLGARGVRFAINPGSSAARTRAELVVAVELVETSRLWARTVAPVRAEWIEEVGAHLLRRHHSEPRWSIRGGQCVATEKVTLLGIPVIAGRTVGYGRIDPVVAREVFIQSALVEGQWRTRHHFWARNQAVRAEAEEIIERTRRRDLAVDDATIGAFYDARIPAEVVSVAHFDSWWRTARRTDDHLLDLGLDDLLLETEVDAEDFPTSWRIGGSEYPIDYVFDPGSGNDGVTVNLPLASLNQVRPEPFSWQVPGRRAELALALIRGLPKQWRSRLVPAPDTAAAALSRLGKDADASEPFWLALGRAVLAVTGTEVPAGQWRPEEVPDHLRVQFRIASGDKVVATGRDLAGLQTRLSTAVAATLDREASHLTHPGATSWQFGTLPARLEQPVLGFPALVDQGDKVAVRVMPDQAGAGRSHRAGLRRLVALTSPDPTTWVVSRLSNRTRLSLATQLYPSVPALLADVRLRAIGDLAGTPRELWAVRDEAAFSALRDRVRSEAAATMLRIVGESADILQAGASVQLALPEAPPTTREDVAEQLAGLLYHGFVVATPAAAWRRYPVYLRAILRRLEAVGSNPRREAEATKTVNALEDEYAALCQKCPPGPLPEPVADIGWLIEELRISLFAQALGTAVPVSAKRVRTAMAAVAGTGSGG